MAKYVLENRPATVEFVPSERPASASGELRDPSGALLQSLTATVDPVVAEVASVTAQDHLVVTSGTGIRAGRQYWHVSQDAGAETLVLAARFDAGDLVLEAPVAGAVRAGDLIVGATLSATLSAIATRGLFHRIDWTVGGEDGQTRVHQQAVHVCRTLFRPAVLPDEASRYLVGAFPHLHVDKPFGYFAELARRASARVERKLVAGRRYPHLVGDSAAFADAGIVALRIELALEGLVPPGFDPAGYVRATDEDLGTAVQEAIAGLWYDEDDDGSVATQTEVSGFYSMRLVRR